MGIGKKLGKLGGGGLGALGSAIDSAAKKPKERGADAARGAGEHIQGEAAVHAARTGNMVTRLASGEVSPFRGGDVRVAQHATAHNAKQDQKSRELAITVQERASREGGVASGKVALVELVADNSRDARQAILLLIQTSSFPEIQNALISGGPNAGKRVYETAAWQELLSDPQHSEVWRAVGAKRPDITPDVLLMAQNALNQTYADTPGDAAGRPVLDALNANAIHEAIGRFGPDNVGTLHEGFFNEVDRLANPALSQILYDALHHIRGAPGIVGENAIGSLSSHNMMQAIDDALSHCGQSYATI